MRNNQVFWAVVIAQCAGAVVLNTLYSKQSSSLFDRHGQSVFSSNPAPIVVPSLPSSQGGNWGHLRVTPLMLAAGDGKVDEVARLLATGVDVNSVDIDGSDALMYAASGGQLEAVRLLLAAGADTRQVNQAGDSAKSLAKQQGFAEILELITAAN
jgi:hypothetical protein